MTLANTASGGLPAPLDDAAFWQSFAEEVLELLLYEYFRAHRPGVFGVLRFLGIAVSVPTPPAGVRAGYTRRGFDWDNLAKAATDPRQLFTDVYKWGGAFDHVAFMDNTLALVTGFGAPAFPDVPSDALLDMYFDPAAPVRKKIVEIHAPVYWAMVISGSAMASVDLSLVLLPIPAIGDHTGDPVGFMLTPALAGEASETVKLSESVDLVLKGKLDSVGVLRIEIRPTGVDFASSPAGPRST